ncbi:hypothetical protein CfE428DRAFT_1452 [Chthoniobacter flavus Ellin428]|uniref:Uncharacterized protein n=1 Tax=Chthoniobacter flavus Ellin428 TaxID=497964 RepID=B4CY11_9BACT|nr:hypothetical protein [Chthoniobacter flavus]EDY21159.1 hypothetical protein CfE428DRAFT_1452 [Chthoniobacter flavus Ellin428]TCO87531.1 hypothetical protein EV701_12133 [Chthoniobacter flavus]
MKRLGLLSVLIFGMAFSGQGQVPGTAVPATSKSVFLDAVESTANSSTVNHWRDISGDYSQTKTSSKELDITVRNMSQLPGEFEIEWYFFGKPANGSGRFLYDQGSKKISVTPGAFLKVPVESKGLSAHTVRGYYWYGYNYTSGDKADGWVIRAKVGDEVVRVKASNPLLEQMASDPAGFTKLTSHTKKK